MSYGEIRKLSSHLNSGKVISTDDLLLLCGIKSQLKRRLSILQRKEQCARWLQKHIIKNHRALIVDCLEAIDSAVIDYTDYNRSDADLIMNLYNSHKG